MPSPPIRVLARASVLSIATKLPSNLSKLSLTSKKRSSGLRTFVKALSNVSDRLSIIEAGPDVAESGDTGGCAIR